MKRYPFVLLLFALLSITGWAKGHSNEQFDYPETPVRPVTHTYFGKQVTDNYRWLEDVKSAETQAWFKAQSEYTDSILNQLPGRDSLIAIFECYDQLSVVSYRRPDKRGERYFYRKTLPGESW